MAGLPTWKRMGGVCYPSRRQGSTERRCRHCQGRKVLVGYPLGVGRRAGLPSGATGGGVGQYEITYG